MDATSNRNYKTKITNRRQFVVVFFVSSAFPPSSGRKNNVLYVSPHSNSMFKVSFSNDLKIKLNKLSVSSKHNSKCCVDWLLKASLPGDNGQLELSQNWRAFPKCSLGAFYSILLIPWSYACVSLFSFKKAFLLVYSVKTKIFFVASGLGMLLSASHFAKYLCRINFLCPFNLY